MLEVLRPSIAQKRELTLRYLRQEGLLEGESWALVDLGWNGRLQNSLDRLLAGARRSDGGPHRSLLGFYFALKAPISGQVPLGDFEAKEAFLFDQRRCDTSYTYIPDMFMVMESFCAAPHGSVTGYEAKGDIIRPVYREGSAKALSNWGLATVHQTLRCFGEYLGRVNVEPARWAEYRSMVEALLMEFSCRPSPPEAAAWGAFPYEDDQSGLDSQPLAKPLRLTPATLMHGLKEGHLARFSVAAWMGGSKALTPRPTLRLLQGASAIGKAWRFLSQIIGRR